MKTDLSHHYSKKYFHERDILDVHLAETVRLLHKKNGGKQLLDVGCGTGRLVHYLRIRGVRAFGCEPATPALMIARKINQPHIIKRAVATSLPYPDKSFDTLTLISVIEHLTSGESGWFLSEAKRVLTQHGKIFLVTPNYATIWRYLQGEKWFGYSDPTHINFYTPKKLAKELIQHGFTDIEFRFKTIYHPPYAWEFPGLIQKLPDQILAILTWLLFSTPFWRLKNSFWIAARKI